jgi:hypothetical protein
VRRRPAELLGLLTLAATLACRQRESPPRAPDTTSASASAAAPVPAREPAVQPTPCGIEHPRRLALVADSAAREPRIALGVDTHTVVLPLPMYRALVARVPGFQLAQPREYAWDIGRYAGPMSDSGGTPYQFSRRRLLSAVVGDFDGDGVDDVVLSGAGDSQGWFGALMSGPDSVRVVEVSEVPSDDRSCGASHTFLEWIGPGRYDASPDLEPEPLVLTTDAFILVYWEKAAEIYYWRDGTFRVYAIAD